MTTDTTLGVIIGNRDFFPDKLVAEARAEITKLFDTLNIKGIMLTDTESKLGGVETFKESQLCAALFKKHADELHAFRSMYILFHIGINYCTPKFFRTSYPFCSPHPFYSNHQDKPVLTRAHLSWPALMFRQHLSHRQSLAAILLHR